MKTEKDKFLGDLEGLCELFFESPELIEKNKNLEKGFSFLEEKNYPIENHYIFLNGKDELVNPERVILLGASNCKIEYKDGIAKVSVCNTSKLTVSLSGFSFVQLNIHHNAEVFIETYDYARMMVKKYSPNVKLWVKKFGENDIKILEE